MFGGSNASDYKIVMAKHHAGSSAVLSSGPAVQLRPHNFVVTCIASQKKFALPYFESREVTKFKSLVCLNID